MASSSKRPAAAEWSGGREGAVMWRLPVNGRGLLEAGLKLDCSSFMEATSSTSLSLGTAVTGIFPSRHHVLLFDKVTYRSNDKFILGNREYAEAATTWPNGWT